MKAITFDHYTDASGLTLADVPTPEIAPDQVLIQVEAAALNAFDWHQYRGDPRIMRLGEGLRVKEPRVVGADLAGTVVEVGGEVKGLSVGDRVIAEPGRGGCAEYAVAGSDAVATLPDNVTFADGAASVMGALTSLQAIRDTATLSEGAHVLVWGASGGVGHLAVQVARTLGADRVDGVCSGRNVAMVRDLGADRAYDYTTEAVTGESYDVIIDTVSTASMRTVKGLLNPGGRLVTIGAVGGGSLLGPLGPLVRRMIAAKALRVDARQMFAHANPADLSLVAGWLGDGSVRPAIQRIYPLAEAAEACRELERGHVAGKLVIAVT